MVGNVDIGGVVVKSDHNPVRKTDQSPRCTAHSKCSDILCKNHTVRGWAAYQMHVANGSSASVGRRTGRVRLSCQALCICCGAERILTSLWRFWAVAARINSSFAPHDPRNRSRPNPRMRLRWAKSISTFFLSRIETACCLVLQCRGRPDGRLRVLRV